MSIDWQVTPALPEVEGFREWFRNEKVEIPNERGRFPTLDELIDVLESFEGLSVGQDASNGIILIGVGSPEKPGFALIMGSVNADGYFNFYFDGWRNEEINMVTILKKLSVFCGPLVLWEQYGATPVVITRDTDLDAALKDWHDRFQKKYPE